MDQNYVVPVALLRISTLVVFAESAFLISWHSRLTERSASQTNLSAPVRSRASELVGGFLAVWFAIAVVVVDGANFPLQQGRLALLLGGLVSFVPFLMAAVWLFASKTGKAINEVTAPASLIGIQFYRVAGILFIFPYLAYGALPAGFAWSAGVGDMLTGIFAPIVVWSVLRKHRASYGLAVAWNLFDILDLVVAPVSAILSGARVIEMYPIALVPLFVGPPIGILTHIASLRNLSVNRERIVAPPT
jgi:hypothetical protein